MVPRVYPKNNFPERPSETPLPVDESVPGEVSAAVTEVFAADHWCSETPHLTADNKQHTLLLGHVSEQQRTGPGGPGSLEEASQQRHLVDG